MRVSDLETETLGSQSQFLKLRLSEVSLSFETEIEKLLMTETDTRLWTIFEIETTRDRPLDVETETESLADLWPWGSEGFWDIGNAPTPTSIGLFNKEVTSDVREP